MSGNEMGKRIKDLRIANNMTLEQVADKVGVGKSTVRKWETGMIANMKRDKIAALAAALHTTPAYLMGWDEDTGVPPIRNIIPMPETKKVPLFGTIACGTPILAVEDACEYAEMPSFVTADFALRCKGDSMITARIFDGDIVFIKSQPIVENGEIAAVRIGDEATLKKVFYTPGSDRVVLQACNPLYPDLVYTGEELNEIEILGKAVYFLSEVRS